MCGRKAESSSPLKRLYCWDGWMCVYVYPRSRLSLPHCAAVMSVNPPDTT